MLSTRYSNFGPEIELVAPGGDDLVDRWNDGWTDGIASALYDETVYPPVPRYGSYVGTSQAAPHVVGAIALLLSIDPSLTAPQLRDVLTGSALDVGVPGRDVGHGFGLLQVHEAVKVVRSNMGDPVVAAPKLMLPGQSIRFPGFSVEQTIPLFNEGGGRVELTGVTTSTFSGGAGWLSAALVPADLPGGPISHPSLQIRVDRDVLRSDAGQYAGHVRLFDALGMVVGRIEVVANVNETARIGCIMRQIILNVDDGAAPRAALARPEFGYRYWIQGMPAATYRLRAGEDLNRNGVFCESGEACGFFGGLTEGDAVPVPFRPTEAVRDDLDIRVVPPGP